MATVTDCLVLKIDEYDPELDTRMFIIYDKRNCNFVIRGKRRNGSSSISVPYSFDCNNTISLINFISFAICKKNKLSYVLYNYDNLPEYSDDITYEFLDSCADDEYEISAYDNLSFSRKTLIRNIYMLKDIGNTY